MARDNEILIDCAKARLLLEKSGITGSQEKKAERLRISRGVYRRIVGMGARGEWLESAAVQTDHAKNFADACGGLLAQILARCGSEPSSGPPGMPSILEEAGTARYLSAHGAERRAFELAPLRPRPNFSPLAELERCLPSLSRFVEGVFADEKSPAIALEALRLYVENGEDVDPDRPRWSLFKSLFDIAIRSDARRWPKAGLLLRREGFCEEGIAEIFQAPYTEVETWISIGAQDVIGVAPLNALIVGDDRPIADDLKCLLVSRNHRVLDVVELAKCNILLLPDCVDIVFLDVDEIDDFRMVESIYSLRVRDDALMIYVASYPERVETARERYWAIALEKPFSLLGVETAIAFAVLHRDEG
jgi:hypothetical protein